MNEYIPKYDEDAEKAIIGAAMSENNAINEIQLKPSDFYRTSNQVIWKMILDMFRDGQAIDVVTLSDRLNQSGDLENIGGTYYLIQMVEKVVTSANIEFHAKIVKEKAIDRYVRECAIKALQAESTQDAIHMMEKVNNLGATESKKIKHISDIIDQHSSIESYYAMSRSCLHSGYQVFDDNVIIKPGDYLLLAGRPSMGKTGKMLNLSKQFSKNGHVSGIFSIEMRSEYLIKRLAHSESFNSGFDGYKAGCEKVCGLPIYIDDSYKIDAQYLTNQISYAIRRYKYEIVFIDYLTLLDLPNTDNMHKAVTELSANLKRMARRFNIPICVLCQLNRGVESRSSKRPLLADLRESGSLEQDADIVMFAYRPFYYQNNSDRTKYKGDCNISDELEQNFFILQVAKQRDGKLLDIRFNYTMSNQSFHLWDEARNETEEMLF